MWDRLGKRLTRSVQRHRPSGWHYPNESQPDIPWIAADDSPWKVSVLDVRPYTQTALALSADPKQAANSVSWARDDGTAFIHQAPPIRRSSPASLRYRRDRLLAEGVLFLPRQMEQMWAIFFHANRMIVVHGWLREVRVVAEVKQQADVIEVTSIRGAFSLEQPEEDALTIRVLDYLIRTHALGLSFPAPLPEGLERDPKQAASWCFSSFGNLAHFATPYELRAGMPDLPLRSNSLFHIAIARADTAAAEAELRKGVPVDLLARDGLPPLQWALARDDVAMLDWLVVRGSAVDVRSAEGATALMTCSQHEEPEHLRWLLAHGADPNARDNRGFTALHRAAVLGYSQVAETLIAAGADTDVEAEGDTPLSLAEAKGHEAVAELLRT